MAARRRLESGDIDPNDVSKKQPDLEIFAFHLGGNLRTLLDTVTTWATLPPAALLGAAHS